jgi:cyclic pyranopterin phosphate synthase
MEAMVGAAAAGLTVYDMLKGVERGVEIRNVRLERKSGGASGLWTRDGATTGAAGGPGSPNRGPRRRDNRGR